MHKLCVIKYEVIKCRYRYYIGIARQYLYTISYSLQCIQTEYNNPDSYFEYRQKKRLSSILFLSCIGYVTNPILYSHMEIALKTRFCRV